MKIENTALQSVIDYRKGEYKTFKNMFYDVCQKYPQIAGCMCIGSLVQDMLLPSEAPSTPQSPQGVAYELIRNRSRRRVFPTINSDLDIWIATENPDDADKIAETIELRSIELIEWLAKNINFHISEQWIDMKKRAFGEFYKNPYLYSTAWKYQNSDSSPWDAEGFKKDITKAFLQYLPDAAKRVNRNFFKKVPGSFFEIRAYPQCTFNLRPEEIIVNGREDRSPFPRIVNQDWIDPQRNALVLYSGRDFANNLIYPFNANGTMLGQKLGQHLNI